MDSVKYKGRVKWFSTSGESFGFINRFKHNNGQVGEIFFHYKNILEDNQEDPRFRALNKGDQVEFEIAPGFYCDGSQAINVRRLNAVNPGVGTSQGSAE